MIIFRPINNPLPDYFLEDLHWQVEFWPDDTEACCPSGIAFVSAGPTMRIVDYVLVRDDLRRQGVATALVKACEERWPDIMLTDAISDMGEGFLASLESEETE